MIVRALDKNNDWTFGKGRNNYLRDQFAVTQNIKTRLQSFLGDCFFAVDQGIDWFNLLGGKNEAEIRLNVTSSILNTQEVTGIVALGVELRQGREIFIEYTVNTAYGPVADEVEFDFTLAPPDPEPETFCVLTHNQDIIRTTQGEKVIHGR